MYRIVSALGLTGGLGRGIGYSRRNNMDYTEIFDCKMWSSIFACVADQNTDAEVCDIAWRDDLHGAMICKSVPVDHLISLVWGQGVTETTYKLLMEN